MVGILRDAEVVAHPLHGVGQRVVGRLRPAALHLAIDHAGVGWLQTIAGDDQRGDCRARHAAGCVVLVDPIAVAAAGRLHAALRPIVQRELPGLVRNAFHARSLGLVQGQHGKLGVAVVGRAADRTLVGPASLVGVVAHLAGRKRQG